MVTKRPALIVQVANSADIVSAVNLARDYRLLTSVRGGGHGISGNALCEGGLTIDCSQMAKVTCDPEARSALVGPGALLGAVDAATDAATRARP